MSYDVFISYRRVGGEHSARMIRDSLTEMGYDVFFDVESLRSGNFNTKLYSVIDECTDFVLILSPDALNRCSDEKDWVRREVEYAISKNKNIVPILLRGFSFDCELPDSLKILPQLNGIEASTEFFDAFIEKLQKFLKTKPSPIKSVAHSSLLKKTLPVLISLALIACVIFGINLISDRLSGIYPRTKTEKSLTDEVVYYVGTNLTQLEIMADSASDAIDAAKLHLSYSDSADSATLKNTLDVCRQLISGTDLTGGKPSEGFVNRLSSSPYKTDDLIAMHDAALSFRDEWLQNIDFIEYIAGDSCYFPKQTKAEIIGYYKEYLDESLNMYACITNMIFTCVTNEDALDELHSKILPELSFVPLNSQNWIYDYSILENSETEHFNKLEKIVGDIRNLTGNLNEQIHNSPDVHPTEKPTETATVPQADFSELTEKLMKLRKDLLPDEDDNYDTLWFKMMALSEYGFYDDARVCADMCRELDEDPSADIYMDSLDAFIDLIEKEGLMYGCLVTGYYEPDGINELLEIGDILTAIDGKEFRSIEEHNEIKSALESENYKLTVLRPDSNGKLKRIVLDCQKSMPRVYMCDLVNYTEAE
ncbi:MAG: TIR domain-containing protein [Acutalibacteraceae bacterium]|nr:TIR domain-containing protein [Acutalibacteraceae bacterium]